MKRIPGILLKIIGYTVLVILSLVFVAYYALQLPEVQTQISTKATEWLGEKLGGNISMSKVRVSWFDEVVFEDLNIKDYKDRNMIYVREVYVNAKTNFKFNLREAIQYDKKKGIKSLKFLPGNLVKFDNNLDFVTLTNPEINFIKDSTGQLNFDYWLAEIDKLTEKKNREKKPVKAFTLDNAHIKNGRFRIITEHTKRKTDGTFDFANFDFENLNTRLEKVSFKRDTIVFVSKNLSANDLYSKLILKNMTGNFFHCRQGIRLDNLVAHLNDSYIRNRVHMSYSRPSDFGDFFHKINLDGDLKNTVLQAKDIALFIPALGGFTEEFRLNTKLKGTVDNLKLTDLLLEFGKGSKIAGDTKFVGLPNLKTMHNVFDLKPSVLLHQDIAQYSNNVEFQKYIKKIDRLDFSGHFNGVYNDFHSRPKLVSSKLGEIVGEVKVKALSQLEYSGNLLINKFKVGELLDQPQLDEITFTGKVNGVGRKLEEAKIHLDGYVSSIDFRGYRYKNINVDGSLGHSLFEGKLKIDDPNVLANLEGRVDFNQAINAFNFEGNVGHANLKVLGFTNKEFLLKTNLNFDFKGNKLDDWLGEASFFNFEMQEDGKSLKADSLYFYSDLVGKERSFKAKTGFLDANIKGNFTPSSLIRDISALAVEHVMYFKTTENERTKYYNEKRTEGNYSTGDYKVDFAFKFNEPKPFFDFFAPMAYVSKGTSISGDYAAGLVNKLNISGHTDTLSLKGNEFYATVLDYSAQKEVLSPTIINKVRIKSDKQKTGNNTLTEELVINANWEGSNTIDFRTFVTQNSSASLLDLRGKLDFYPEGFSIGLLPEQTTVKLIDLDWHFADGNRLEVEKKKISFKNIAIIGGDNQSISLNGLLSTNPSDVVTLDVNEFNIENLLPFMNVELKGIATGSLRVSSFYNNPLYVSNLNVQDFYYKKSLLGTITTSAVWDETYERLRVQGNIFREMEEILRLEGFYKPNQGRKSLDIKGRMHNADLSIFKGMTGDVFSRLSGKANGDFKISGVPKKPIFDGEIDITDGSLEVAVSGTELYFSDKVLLTEKGFELPENGVVVKDAPNGNSGILTGGVYYKNGMPGFDVNINANIAGRSAFKLMNIKPFANDYIFGTAFASGDINLGGDFDDLIISGNLTSREGTHITIPTDGGTKIDTQQEGIAFIKKAVPVDSSLLVNKKKTSTIKTGGVRLAFNLTLTPEAEGDIVFDRTNNDILHIYGDGKLSVLFDSRGEFSINGPYNVKGGKYFFSFQNLASLRRFDISDKSKIIFNGNPFDAVLDITATYTANISLNKVSPQMANSTARFPVYVNVFLKNRILTPTIAYDIGFDLKQVPISGQTDILAFEQRLRNDEQLLGRNVTSILVFNEVFPENNMAEAFTQQFLIDNISSLLSNQIGNLASKINPNLEFGVRFGDFRENLLNNMQLDFSYKFLNNRIKLSGKGAFINSLENNMIINTNTYGQFSVGGELEYLISDDGAYRFRLYSRSVPTNYYVFYSQGNVVVSGGSFIISRNFNSFFKRKELKSVPLGVGSSENSKGQ